MVDKWLFMLLITVKKGLLDFEISGIPALYNCWEVQLVFTHAFVMLSVMPFSAVL